MNRHRPLGRSLGLVRVGLVPAVTLAAALVLPACGSESSEPVFYGDRGTLSVGHRVLTAPGGVPVKTWYPALGSASVPEAISYPVDFKFPDWRQLSPAVVHGRARADAPIDGARGAFPLVIFSHGYALNPAWYSQLVEHYASRGFVVLAPEHQENDWLQASAASFDRPADVKRTLDLAETLGGPGGEWEGLIDLTNVAVVGHSYGGYTALAVAGGRFDLGPFHARCGALAADDPRAFLCAPFLGREAEMATRAGLAAVPGGLWPTTMADPRVTAIVSMAGDAFLMNESGLASVTVPMMALGGTVDFATPWDWGAKLSYDNVSSRAKSLVAFEGADHMIPVNPCEELPFTAQLSDEERAFVCLDAASWPRQAALPWIRHASTAFLLDVLKQDGKAHEALLSGAMAQPGIAYTTTLR
jgi:predicted dienelactone hydrolase